MHIHRCTRNVPREHCPWIASSVQIALDSSDLVLRQPGELRGHHSQRHNGIVSGATQFTRLQIAVEGIVVDPRWGKDPNRLRWPTARTCGRWRHCCRGMEASTH